MANRLIRFFRYLVFWERGSFRIEEADKIRIQKEIICADAATNAQKSAEPATLTQKRTKEGNEA